MEPQKRIAVGSALATAGALAVVIITLLGDTIPADSWVSIVSFIGGIAVGSGVTLAVAGLVEWRRSRRIYS